MMIFPEEKYKFMYAALQEAQKAFDDNEVPIGCVVVKENKIIAKGYNQTERLKDPTAHAEMIAITSACYSLSEMRLNECDIYTTVEPCIMCTGAILHARIANLYFACFDPKFGACGSLYNLIEEEKSNHKIKIFSGIYEKESSILLQEFFKKKRMK